MQQLPPQVLSYPPMDTWAVIAILLFHAIVAITLVCMFVRSINRKHYHDAANERLDNVVGCHPHQENREKELTSRA